MSARRPTDEAGGQGPRRYPRVSLYVSVCLINATMFALAVTVLVVSPATVSSDVTLEEKAVLVVGMVVVVTTNALLLRGRLLPVDRLARQLGEGDAADPAWRLPPHAGTGVERAFVVALNSTLDRLAAERLAAEFKARAAEDAERRRIARELHDEVGQRLTVVLMSASRLLRQLGEREREELQLIVTNSRESLTMIRSVAEGLRGGVLEDIDLLGALTSLATTFDARDEGGDAGQGHRFRVLRQFDRSLPEVSPEIQLAVFRVAQEALTNAARHSAADCVVVTVGADLVRGHRQLMLTVHDNGVGCPPQASGYGLAGMQERARAVGGRLSVEPGGGGGTRVHLVVPLPVGRGA